MDAVATSGPVTAALPIRAIQTDGTMLRAALNEDAILDYSAHLDALPDIVIFRDAQGRCFLGDGRHRLEAFLRKGRDHIPCLIYFGDLRDAILYAAASNDRHGVRRTPADKRKCVTTLLVDADWKLWCDNEIARRCHVAAQTVARCRTELEGGPPEEESTRLAVNGQGKTVQVKAVHPWSRGRRRKPASENGTDHAGKLTCPKCGFRFAVG